MTKEKLQYDVVLTKGKSARELKRTQEKKKLEELKGKLQSPLGKMRSRQERKAMAKALKINFNPRYNGTTLRKKEFKLVEFKYPGKSTVYLRLQSAVN